MPDYTDPFAVPKDIAPSTPVHTEIVEDDSLDTLENALKHYDNVTNNTAKVRNVLMGKILPAVMDLDLKVDSGTDPDVYAAQTRLVGEMRQLLNDMDSSAQKHAAIKLKRKDQDIDKANAINGAELLKHIKLSAGFPVCEAPALEQHEIDAAINKQFEDSGAQVLDTELIQGDGRLPEKKVNDEL